MDGSDGRGIATEIDALSGVASQVTLSGCWVAGNRSQAIFIVGGNLTADTTVVRDTLPNGQGLSGRGIVVQPSPQDSLVPTAHISQSLVDGNGTTGIFGVGAELTVERTVVRRTLPDSTQWFGRGINIRPDPALIFRPVLHLSTSVIAESYDVGIFVGGGDAIIDRTLIQDTWALPELGFGDGITVFGHSLALATAHLVDSRLARSDRAGLANFGSTVTLERVHVDCCPIALNGEQEFPHGEIDVSLPFTFNDWGGNVCGCGPEVEPCKVLSAGLAPPQPGP
jgi:hypothetical protein